MPPTENLALEVNTHRVVFHDCCADLSCVSASHGTT